MKKLLSLLLVCLLTVFCFASCKNDSKEGDNTGSQSDTANPSQEEPTAEKPDDPTPAEPPEGVEKTLRFSSGTKGVHIYGKRISSSTTNLSCDYSGSGIEFVVNSGGGDMKIQVNATAPCRFLVTLDGKICQFSGNDYITVEGTGYITIPNLSKETHTVRIIKLTGYEQARAKFLSMTYYGTFQTNEVAADKEFTVEFLGGSAASGIGAKGDYTDQDATLAYTYRLAQELQTEYSIFAFSDGNLMKQITDSYAYANVMDDPETEYDFAKPADVTVIHIPSEDQDADTFLAAYRNLVQLIREKNGRMSRIVCVYNTSDTVAKSTIDTVCQEFGGADGGMFSVGVTVKDSGVLTADEQAALAAAIKSTLEEAIQATVTTGTLVPGVNGPDMNVDYDDPVWND